MPTLVYAPCTWALPILYYKIKFVFLPMKKKSKICCFFYKLRFVTLFHGKNYGNFAVKPQEVLFVMSYTHTHPHEHAHQKSFTSKALNIIRPASCSEQTDGNHRHMQTGCKTNGITYCEDY